MEKRERVEIKHPLHPHHPLILFEDEDVEAVLCEGCIEPISAPFYACEPCIFFMHKFCAELPQTLMHFFHTQHPLHMTFPWEPFCECEVCGVATQNKLSYGCANCEFTLDIKCASVVLKFQQMIDQSNHTHKFVPLNRPAMFLCNACNTEHGGSSFLCTECGFWANQECASSPTTVKLGAHVHLLTLLKSISTSIYNPFGKPDCQICFKTVKRNQWVYFCGECKYFVHVRCATSEIKHSSDSKAKIEPKKIVHPNVMELPWTNDSAADDLIAQLIKNIISSMAKKSTTTNDDVVNCQTIMNSYIHQHPLISSKNLKTEHHHGESSSSSSSIIVASCKQSENKLCNGCGYTILTGVKFYYCAESECHNNNNNFYLHQWCARLPNELEPRFFQGLKFVLITPQSPNFTPRKCFRCGIYCDTFFFQYADGVLCMDVKCAGLSRAIRHKSHYQHVLYLYWFSNCNACGTNLGSLSFACEACKYRVCISCALLPESVRHRYDKHPFTLTYSFPNAKEVYYCEICEEDIEPNRWFYHCHEYCDQSLHIKCIFPNFSDEYSNIKCKTIFKPPYHPHHSVTCVPTPENNGNDSLCSLCGKSIVDTTAPFIVKCTECNFLGHLYCKSP